MSTERVEALEQAILERARLLAQEHVQQGERGRERILEDSREKIRLLEEKEILAGQSRAEREYRRLVQARELGMQAELDHLRWGLVQSVIDDVMKRLEALAADEQRYRPLFGQLLGEAARSIERPELVVRVSAEDLSRLGSDWQTIAGHVAPDKTLELADEPVAISGGARVADREGRIEVDNSFEGVIARLETELHRVVVEHLFPSASRMGILFSG